ncbi:MAG: methionine synthase [Promethearchaeota archaeon]
MKFNGETNDIPENEKILLACIGQCVHVAGTYNFMQIAQELGFNCKFLGPATPISTVISEIEKEKPFIVGLSYRLTPETVIPLLDEFFEEYDKLSYKPKKIFFASTPDVVKIAKKYSRIDEFFVGGESNFDIITILRGEKDNKGNLQDLPMDLISRIEWKKPYPIIRAHFGLPNLTDTIEGIKKIAESKVLDVISIAPDQNTQANYFHPEDQNPKLAGAGGVPLRTREDFIKLHEARLRGNYPLLRIYAGTRDFIELGKLFKETINNAWAAIPIFWFNQMDGRGPLSLEESIKQHLEAIKWHGENNIPVEINDPHHWGLRDAPDAIVVADMYLCGIIAKKLGVKHFVAQYMFNTPPSSSLDMDLAKILAMDELLQTLEDDNFKVIRQVRTGLASFPLDLNRAKGHLASTLFVQLMIKPDIIHIVTHCEADHAAKPEDIIESCKIVEQVVKNVYSSSINIDSQKIQERKEELIKQAKWIINLIPYLARDPNEAKDPYINYKVLARLVHLGIFDAPQLKNNKFALGKIKTRIIDGACYSWDNIAMQKLDEIERIVKICNESGINFMETSQLKVREKINSEVVEK